MRSLPGILGIVVQMPGYTELPFPGCSAAGLRQRSLQVSLFRVPLLWSPSCHRFLLLCSYGWCTRDGPEQGLRSPKKHFRWRVTSGFKLKRSLPEEEGTRRTIDSIFLQAPSLSPHPTAGFP